MEDVTVTQLFQRMDAHLERQDAHLARHDVEFRVLHETLAKQNTALEQMAQLLATTAREVAAIHAEASRHHAATMAGFEALLRRLDRERP
jgi:peptidoglycan hydrolase CwlO-like protein